MEVHIYGEITQFYTYRSGLLDGQFAIIEEHENSDIWKWLSIYLNRQGYKMDNHIAFMTDKGIAYAYSDHSLRIGKSITKYNW